MFVLRALGLQSDRWGNPLPVSRRRWVTIGIVIGSVVSIDFPSKFNGDGISMMAAGMLGGAIGGAVLLLIIALVYNSAIARDSVRRGRRRVTHGMGTPIL